VSSSDAVVVVEDLYKTFVLPGPWPWSHTKDVKAVNGGSLELQTGEVVAPVRQTGSGTTTFGRCVLGLEATPKARSASEEGA